MTKYRKKPVVIDAIQITRGFGSNWDAIPDWLKAHYEEGNILFLANGVSITTLEGVMLGNIGDWLIQGVQNELYPCKDEIFQATYVRVEDNNNDSKDSAHANTQDIPERVTNRELLAAFLNAFENWRMYGEDAVVQDDAYGNELMRVYNAVYRYLNPVQPVYRNGKITWHDRYDVLFNELMEKQRIITQLEELIPSTEKIEAYETLRNAVENLVGIHERENETIPDIIARYEDVKRAVRELHATKDWGEA